jgi:hypothetical protein
VYWEILPRICLKIPKWFQAYGAGIVVSKKMTQAKASMDVLTLSELRFNVAWNIWREMAEIDTTGSDGQARRGPAAPPPPGGGAKADARRKPREHA